MYNHVIFASMKKKARSKESHQYALLLNHDLRIKQLDRTLFQPFLQRLVIKTLVAPNGKQLKTFDSYLFTADENTFFPDSMTRDLLLFGVENWILLLEKVSGDSRSMNKTDVLRYMFSFIAKHTKLTLERLTEHAGVQWYHKIPNGENKTLYQKIEFVKTYHSLSIQLIKTDDGFNVDYSLITDEQETISSQDLQLFFGFLRRSNVYFSLKIKDLNVLYLLQGLNIHQHRNNLPAFIKYILQPIEKTHKVVRDDFVEVEVQAIIPKKQLHLTELAGSFLVITPKFDYDLAVFDSQFQEFEELLLAGKYYKIKRHKEEETSFRTYLKSLHPRFLNQFTGSHNLSFDDAKKGNWFFKVYHEWLDQNIEILGVDLMKNFKYSPFSIATKLTSKGTTGNMITFECEVNFGKEKVKLTDIKKVLLSGGKNVYLKDNSLGILTDAWLDEYALIFKHGTIAQEEITVPKWLGVSDETETKQKNKKFSISSDWWERWNAWQNSDAVQFEIPKSIHAELRPYQHKGFEWMVLLNEINAGACLADDMGLGKTLQTIAFMAHIASKNAVAKMLVICPASLLYNWKNEIEKFAPQFNTHVYYGINRDFDEFIANNDDILICSYATARNDIEILKSLVWDIMVLDESHNIRSLHAQTTKAIHQIDALSNVVLSGTPMVNNTFDLFAQFEVILPGFFGGQEFFNRTYATPIDRHNDSTAIQQLNKLTKPFILRRTKQQVATDLPEKFVSILYCDMNQDQRDAYESVKSEIGKSVFLGINEKGLEKSKLHILQAISKLRQICCHPILVAGGAFEDTSSVKLNLLIEEIERNLGNHKVLVFSQFIGMLDAISEALHLRNIGHFRFDGSTAAQKRMEMVDSFQKEDSNERVFLASLKAGNTGITLTEADYVFLVDPWWNEAIQRQAIDRTHRIGQKKTVFAYKMICKDTVEERMLQLQQRKQFISDELIVEDENMVKNLTLEDVQFLLG